MAMSKKVKLLIVGVLMVVTLSLVFHNSWIWVVYVLVRDVALNLVSLPGVAKIAGGTCNVHFLP